MSDYTSASEIKTALNITVTTYDTTLGTIATAVSRAIDEIQDSRYFSTDETRYYTAYHPYHDLNIDDLNTLGTITVDTAGTGSYDTTWTLGTHFSLEPINNSLEGKPYRLVRV